MTIVDYSTAISLDPKLHEAYGLRGRGYIRRQDYDRAIADETTAIEVNRRELLTYFQLRGDAYSLKGDSKSAIVDYTEIIDDQVLPYRDVWLVKRAKEFEALGQIDEAIADYSDVMKSERSAKLYRERAALYKSRGDDALAAADLLEAKRLNEMLSK